MATRSWSSGGKPAIPPTPPATARRAALAALPAAANEASTRLVNRLPDNATPNAPPSERKNDTADVATPSVSGATAFWIATVRFGMTSPSPAPVTTSAASIAGSGAASRTAAAIATKPVIARPSPSTDKPLYLPSAETSRPPITEAMIRPAISGADSSPACDGLLPSTSWKKVGRKTKAPNSAVAVTATTATATAKTGFPNNANGRIGSTATRSRATSSTHNPAAPSASPAIAGDDHAATLPPQLRSSNNAAVVTVSSTAPA